MLCGVLGRGSNVAFAACLASSLGKAFGPSTIL